MLIARNLTTHRSNRRCAGHDGILYLVMLDDFLCACVLLLENLGIIRLGDC